MSYIERLKRIYSISNSLHNQFREMCNEMAEIIKTCGGMTDEQFERKIRGTEPKPTGVSGHGNNKDAGTPEMDIF